MERLNYEQDRLGWEGHDLTRLGDRTREEACAQEAKRLSQHADDEALSCRAALALGNVFWRTSRLAEAETEYRRALAIANNGTSSATRPTAAISASVVAPARHTMTSASRMASAMWSRNGSTRAVSPASA